MKVLLTIPFILSLSMCPGPKVDNREASLRPVDPRIETCSAGSSVKISAEAEADLTKILEGQGSVTGTVEREVETMISQAAGNSLSGAQLVQAQENYLRCLRDEAELAASIAKPWENYSSNQCTAFAHCEDTRMAMVATCRTELQKANQPYRECYSNLTSKLVACFSVKNADQLQLARSFCEANYNI